MIPVSQVILVIPVSHVIPVIPVSQVIPVIPVSQVIPASSDSSESSESSESSKSSESSESSESSDQVRLAHLWVDFRVICFRCGLLISCILFLQPNPITVRTRNLL